ncbi:response regulator transcription factor [Nocardioides zeicaulis]|uniref:Response regulator transcription factor n=1 Tax=Nocardioides zeicaulis TaxID=1776857 RepID=A0ABV6E4G2_9ACTN
MPTTVLIVEDEPDLVHVMELTLKRAGFGVVAAATGGEGRTMLAQHEVHVVVMDRGLPDMDGLEATQLLRGDGYDGAIIVVSGHVGGDHVAASLEAGADEVLSKPFKLAELVELVHHVVAPVAEVG